MARIEQPMPFNPQSTRRYGDASATPLPAPSRAGALPLAVVQRREGTAAAPAVGWRILRVVRFVPLVMALVATGGVVGLYFQPPGVRKLMEILQLQPGGGTSSPIAVPVNSGKAGPMKAAPAAPAPRVVAGLGKLLPEGEVVVVAPPFGAGDARIATLHVSEGERVERGAVLATLDSERPFQAAVKSARALVAAREAALAQVMASVEASRDEARASLARAETALQNAGREFERVETLRQRGYAAEQVYDQRRTARDEAAREVERVRAILSRYGSGPIETQADVLVAARNVDTGKADLARAIADLDKASVRAPIAGTVLTVHVRPGEKPGNLGILNLGNLERMIAEVEVYQTQIGRVAVGDRVDVTAEALPRPLKGAVTRIGLEVGRQTLIDANPAANTDARVVKVTVALEPESSSVAQRFTNLQVTARIATRSEP
jgi:HlyD family secretion protein